MKEHYSTALRIVFAVVLSLGIAASAAAQDRAGADPQTATPSGPLSDEQATSLKNNLMSPFCPGRTLSGCSSYRAAEWRAEIDAWAAQGVPEQEIKRRLQARVPEFTLDGTPRGHWRWSIAVIAVLLATAALLAYVRFSRRAASPLPDETSAPGRDLSDDEDDRLDDLLDDELARLD